MAPWPFLSITGRKSKVLTNIGIVSEKYNGGVILYIKQKKSILYLST